jgi:hypothetical protein
MWLQNFFKYIRPGAQRIQVETGSDNPVRASAYIHEENQTLTFVILNGSASEQPVKIKLDSSVQTSNTLAFVSSENNYWQPSSSELTGPELEITLPAFSVATIYTDINLSTGTRNLKKGNMKLFQNNPNPASAETQIGFEIKNRAHILLTLRDIRGKQLKTLVNEVIPAGSHVIKMDTENLSPGIYFYSLNDGKIQATKKMIVMP